ncbi:MAG: hypothetical protein R3A52_25160 [Polyangiales bacterium]
MSAPEKNWLEWAVFGVSLALVVTVVAALLVDALGPAPSPPDLRLSLGRPERRSEGYAVPVTATNQGGLTARAVSVEVRLEGPDGAETSQLEVEFVPRGSRRRGWVTFERDPSRGALRARVVSYQRP